nr:hypothetical protein HK105_002180 [Polyrhizophydium stewartii]
MFLSVQCVRRVEKHLQDDVDESRKFLAKLQHASCDAECLGSECSDIAAYQFPDERASEPDPDMMRFGGRHLGAARARIASACNAPERAFSPSKILRLSHPEVVLKPTPRRACSHQHVPGTPSERSVSASSEDGSSSISSFSTLPSTVSSPDVSRIRLAMEKSAFIAYPGQGLHAPSSKQPLLSHEAHIFSSQAHHVLGSSFYPLAWLLLAFVPSGVQRP